MGVTLYSTKYFFGRALPSEDSEDSLNPLVCKSALTGECREQQCGRGAIYSGFGSSHRIGKIFSSGYGHIFLLMENGKVGVSPPALVNNQAERHTDISRVLDSGIISGSNNSRSECILLPTLLPCQCDDPACLLKRKCGRFAGNVRSSCSGPAAVCPRGVNNTAT